MLFAKYFRGPSLQAHGRMALPCPHMAVLGHWTQSGQYVVRGRLNLSSPVQDPVKIQCSHFPPEEEGKVLDRSCLVSLRPAGRTVMQSRARRGLSGPAAWAEVVAHLGHFKPLRWSNRLWAQHIPACLDWFNKLNHSQLAFPFFIIMEIDILHSELLTRMNKVVWWH